MKFRMSSIREQSESCRSQEVSIFTERPSKATNGGAVIRDDNSHCYFIRGESNEYGRRILLSSF